MLNKYKRFVENAESTEMGTLAIIKSRLRSVAAMKSAFQTFQEKNEIPNAQHRISLISAPYLTNPASCLLDV